MRGLLEGWGPIGDVWLPCVPSSPSGLGPSPYAAVFIAVGVAVLDDYGVSWDEFYQRDIALETISYVSRPGTMNF